MLSDEFESAGVAAPRSDAPNSVSLHLVVASCDDATARPVALGARLDRGPEDTVPAGRIAVIHDPYWHRWFLNQPQTNATSSVSCYQLQLSPRVALLPIKRLTTDRNFARRRQAGDAAIEMAASTAERDVS